MRRCTQPALRIRVPRYSDASVPGTTRNRCALRMRGTVRDCGGWSRVPRKDPCRKPPATEAGGHASESRPPPPVRIIGGRFVGSQEPDASRCLELYAVRSLLRPAAEG